MNFKSILALGLGIATVGVSLPAFADSATIITNDQSAVVTGDGNRTNQTIRNHVNNRERRNSDSSATDIQTNQHADILGDRNQTNQNANNVVRNRRVGNR